MTATTQSPARHARVDVADVLRGLSVLGIILLHSIEHFNFYSFPDTSLQPEWLNFTDKAIWDGLFFLLGGKAYAIFALLFGFSFFIQDDNQRMRGNDFRRRFCWRLILLFIIGNINAVFFTAEILVMYSLIGFVLVLTCRLSTRTLLVLSALCMLQPVAIYHTIRAIADSAYITPSLPTGDLWNAAFAVQSAGTFWDTLKVNIWEGQLASLAWAWDNARVFQTAALFMLGMLMGRQGCCLNHASKTGHKCSAGRSRPTSPSPDSPHCCPASSTTKTLSDLYCSYSHRSPNSASCSYSCLEYYTCGTAPAHAAPWLV